ncbi:MAG: hypothetical protein QF662_03300 [Phycisphaerae bacterium]|nr:hypothetical protein [Phycisphaerae bacterium]
MLNPLVLFNRKRVMAEMKRLHTEERGAQGLELLLIIVAIVLPLLGILIVYRNEIVEWVNSKWADVSAAGNEDLPEPEPVE